MNLKAHYIMTVGALFCLGVILVKPSALHKLSGEERICKLYKGKMDCFTEYKVKTSFVRTKEAKF